MSVFFEVADIALGIAVLLCFLRCFHLILKRGYYWFTGAVACAFAFAAGAGIALLVAGPRPNSVVFGVTEAVSSAAIACALPALFPLRSKRQAGQRRRIWKRTQRVAFTVAGLCSVTAAAAVAWARFYPENFTAILKIDEPWLVPVVLLEVAAIALIIAWGIARRGRTGRDLSETLKKDHRRPVLYLRAFEDDQRPFERTRKSSIWDRHVIRPLSLEDYLTEAIESSMGPLVALGSPNDYLSPGGAAREYAEDDDWRQQFFQLADNAQAILVSPGSSDSLRWELDCLVRARLATKLFVVLGPHAFGPPDRGFASAALHWAEKFTGFPEWRPVNWAEFSRTMTQLGYELPIERPDPSSIIAFDVHAHGSILHGQLQLPQDYIRAIKGYVTLLTPEWQEFFSKVFDHLKGS